jgi:SAM-dependent methyltransferase
MFTRTVSTEDLARLKREREGADRLYNDALTALDGAILRLRELPHAPPAYDEHQITPLNERWELLALKPADGRGWRGRLRALAWQMVEPLFERQQAFNSALVDHVNRNVAMHREAATAIASTLAVLREDLETLITFQSNLMFYAQQVTPYVDTKDREVAGLMRRINEDVAEVADRLDRRVAGLAGGLSGLSDELQKRWESMVVRERRSDAQVNEVRTALAVAQRAAQTFKRELERLSAVEPSDQFPDQFPVGRTFRSADQTSRPTGDLDSYKYVGFEDQFRGSAQEIRARVSAYVPEFEGARDVLDVGCGRGEFLDLLRERAISARGIDLNDEMAALCRDRGLDVTSGDALSHLLAQPDESLGGLFAAQVVEHLEPDYLMRLLDVAYRKLRPGSKIVLETINPACWYAFFASYLRDITHVRPLHPDTLQYLLVANGFQQVVIRYSAPFPDDSKLQPLPVLARSSASGEAHDVDALSAVVPVFNENVRKLNSLLFTYLDYAAIGARP